jgi:hypothetical protein
MSTVRELLKGLLVSMWCRKIPRTTTKRSPSKRSNKRISLLLRRGRTRTKDNYFTCGKTGHYARECLIPKWKLNEKSANMVEAYEGTLEYGSLLPTFFLFVIHLIGGLTLKPIFMCVLVFLYFLLIRSGEVPPCSWGMEHMRLF